MADRWVVFVAHRRDQRLAWWEALLLQGQDGSEHDGAPLVPLLQRIEPLLRDAGQAVKCPGQLGAKRRRWIPWQWRRVGREAGPADLLQWVPAWLYADRGTAEAGGVSSEKGAVLEELVKPESRR